MLLFIKEFICVCIVHIMGIEWVSAGLPECGVGVVVSIFLKGTSLWIECEIGSRMLPPKFATEYRQFSH